MSTDIHDILIKGVHHWDENSLSPDSKQKEPKVIRKIHEQEVEFVKAWMKEWRGRGKWRMGDEWEDVRAVFGI